MVVAECGPDAVDLVRHHPRNYFDVIVLDINMPIMDGFECCQIMEQLL